MTLVDRREFLRKGVRAVAALGSTAVVGSAAACGVTRAKPRPVARRASTRVRPKETLDELAGSLDGQLVLPSDKRYATARLVYDLRFAGETPAAIAYCASSSDVVR